MFDTKELAQQFINLNGDDSCTIEEYELNQEPNREEKLYECYFRELGNVECEIVKWESELKDEFQNKGNRYVFFVRSNSLEKAKKIAIERFTQVKAFPQNYPLLDIKCIDKTYYFEYPMYSFSTHKIVMEKGEKLADGYTAEIEIISD